MERASDAAYEAIKIWIQTARVAPGGLIDEADAARQLSMSRTPVREALRQLHTSGLIEVVPNRGAIVRVPSPWEVRDAYEVRAELEGLACERAVSRINDAELDELRAANQSMRDEVAKAKTRAPADAEPPTVEYNDAFHTLIHRVADNEWLTREINEINQDRKSVV